MFRTLITLIPCFICLDRSLRFLIKKGKTDPQRILTVTAMLGALAFFADAVSIIPGSGYRDMALMSVILQACVFSIFPLFIIYIRSLERKGTGKAVLAAMFLPAALMTGAMLWVWSRIGLDGIAGYLKAYDEVRGIPSGFTGTTYRILQLTSTDIHRALVGIWIAVEWAVLLNILIHNGLWPKKARRLLEGGNGGTQLSAICCAAILFFLGALLRIAVGRFFLMDRPLIQCALYIVISLCIAIVFAVGSRYEGKGAMLPTEARFGAGQDTERHSVLAGTFRRYMEEGEAFRRPDLTLEAAAADLSTNRTYLSEAVRQATGQSFRAYVNTLRIEAAKKEMTEHPEDRLDSIAARTGFSSSSQLVKKFQETTGESPRRWARKQKELSIHQKISESTTLSTSPNPESSHTPQ